MNEVEEGRLSRQVHGGGMMNRDDNCLQIRNHVLDAIDGACPFDFEFC